MILSMQSRRIFSLAIPMIISNISTPLIGMVDTAVVGHMDNASYLAGVALGSLILTQIYWICGFLRMSTTGLSAEAKGKKDNKLAAQVWVQTIGLGLILGLIIVLLQWPLLSAGLWVSDASEGIQSAAAEYFNIRVWSAPVALMNMAVIGWLVGQQQHKFIMWIQITANVMNAVLDLFFVYGLDMSVSGVALASVFAELSIFSLSILFIFKKQLLERAAIVWRFTGIQRLLSLNTDMLIRNLALQLCLAFITYKGISLGDTIAATNAILMQFFVLIALGLDGLAYATEALIGEAKGEKNHAALKSTVVYGLIWSSVFAVVYTLIFALFGEGIVVLLTDIPSLQASANEYFILVLLLPIVAHWCFLLDGVYIGLTNARVMRNSMLLCMLLFFFPTWFYLSVYENWGLWISFLVFLSLRGITLGGHLYWRLGRSTNFDLS